MLKVSSPECEFLRSKKNRIKLSGDGTCIERLHVVCFTFLEESHTTGSYEGNHVLAVFKTPENYVNLFDKYNKCKTSIISMLLYRTYTRVKSNRMYKVYLAKIAPVLRRYEWKMRKGKVFSLYLQVSRNQRTLLSIRRQPQKSMLWRPSCDGVHDSSWEDEPLVASPVTTYYVQSITNMFIECCGIKTISMQGLFQDFALGGANAWGQNISTAIAS